jgi:CHASE1-domain containing sensor protein
MKNRLQRVLVIIGILWILFWTLALAYVAYETVLIHNEVRHTSEILDEWELK